MNRNFDVDLDIIKQTNGSFIFRHFHSFLLKKETQNPEYRKDNAVQKYEATQRAIIIIINIIVICLINVEFTI